MTRVLAEAVRNTNSAVERTRRINRIDGLCVIIRHIIFITF